MDIEVYPYLRDHHLEDRAILPAVEALIVMARAVKTGHPQAQISCMKNASFMRFLSIAPETASQPVFVDMENCNDIIIAASLSTSIKSKTGTASRRVEHARVEFLSADYQEIPSVPFYPVDRLKGECISVPSSAVYSELVPFGAAYHNIIGDLSISKEGALAYVAGGGGEADDTLLGSPFPLDAVMHTACVWGQRFADVVSFPVGFEKRMIYQKTKKGEEYLGRVVPVSITQEKLVFDAWIYKGNVMCESISGIQMMDVTRGRIKPPAWIKA